jgi:ribonuclease HI
MNQTFTLITDGACMKNPGPGGWGLIFVAPDGHVTEYGGHDPESTNNRMELAGYYKGLQETYRRAKANALTSGVIHLIADSKYVLDGAEKYIHGWKRNGWKTSTGGDVKNQDYWEQIDKGYAALKTFNFKFKYELVKGHSGNEGNERADQIAVAFSRGEGITLYDGPLADYPVSIVSGPPFEMVYLCYVDGVLERHKTWDTCQKRVSGKPGARYKKVKNPLEEVETLKLWGLK